ncbi:MAG TPA: iron-containing alcohol dehydrogenase [Giesbergeria sp.]|jgi:NADP-dependent alcohol dehydrogenase|uniref:iron-containing alcohol dehydrogenase n=1 Tax=Simplicispira sedimenti TaxID=2919500 RepID=UPI001FAB0AC9|nr:iron-containing alcohol dehydrogenase [Acidovorax sp. W1-6]MCL4770629.1 iron-containing alcohol dehydrogenase [Burkholderiaceae bacterium]HNE72069.1 iron-containing alcohol dehydrogenase [Giesbergeria sp.]
MLNFEFHNPTRIVFGQGKVADLARLVPAQARVLVLYGGESARRTGTLDEVRAALGERSVSEFGGIEPNPSYETLMRAVEQVRAEHIDYLLAVGGGSVIDGTKFVAAAACFDGEPWDILLQRGRNVQRALPLASVLTLPATGSEMNNGGVVTRKATQAKLSFSSVHCFPQFSVLDPTKTYTLPPAQIANGLVDAYVHVMEQYLTYPVQARPQDRFAEGLLQTLVEIAPGALAEPPDYDHRANLMWTATLALNGLIGAGVPQDWATHMIGHELTALYGIDHARTLAIVLPSLMQSQRVAKRDKLLQYAERVWHVSGGTEDERIDAAITHTRAFFESVGIPTRLSAYGLGREAVDAVVAQLTAHGMLKLGEHRSITPEVSRAILEAAL